MSDKHQIQVKARVSPDVIGAFEKLKAAGVKFYETAAAFMEYAAGDDEFINDFIEHATSKRDEMIKAAREKRKTKIKKR